MTVAEAGSTDPGPHFQTSRYVALARTLDRDVGRLPSSSATTRAAAVGHPGRAAILRTRSKTHEEENMRQRGWSSSNPTDSNSAGRNFPLRDRRIINGHPVKQRVDRRFISHETGSHKHRHS